MGSEEAVLPEGDGQLWLFICVHSLTVAAGRSGYQLPGGVPPRCCLHSRSHPYRQLYSGPETQNRPWVLFFITKTRAAGLSSSRRCAVFPVPAGGTMERRIAGFTSGIVGTTLGRSPVVVTVERTWQSACVQLLCIRDCRIQFVAARWD